MIESQTLCLWNSCGAPSRPKEVLLIYIPQAAKIYVLLVCLEPLGRRGSRPEAILMITNIYIYVYTYIYVYMYISIYDHIDIAPSVG